MVKFDNSYSRLPNSFYQRIKVEEVPSPELVVYNKPLATSIGLEISNLTNLFSGNSLPKESSPIALAYAGHQFGHFTPQLGDGRAVLIGEIINQEKERFDIQLKGSGQTPYSRRGDGKSAIGPAIREYIVSEAMNSLNIPTTRALAVVTTGQNVFREKILPGAIFTRVASSHIRIGTFEYFAARKDLESLKTLTDYTIKRHYPSLIPSEQIYIDFFKSVSEKIIDLVARWMSVGFIHGVMNTDNCAISGETIDYGPCAFMDHFKYDKVYSSIDHHGRYAYNNQGKIAMWNLSSLAGCLAPLVNDNEETAIALLQNELEKLPALFENKWLSYMGYKMGLFEVQANDHDLINNFLKYLEQKHLDFTNSFRSLSTLILQDQSDIPFHKTWKERVTSQKRLIDDATSLMDSSNPCVIPRNHLIEEAIQASEKKDYSYFHKLNKILANPFSIRELDTKYITPPRPEEIIQQTFCGT